MRTSWLSSNHWIASVLNWCSPFVLCSSAHGWQCDNFRVFKKFSLGFSWKQHNKTFFFHSWTNNGATKTRTHSAEQIECENDNDRDESICINVSHLIFNWNEMLFSSMIDESFANNQFTPDPLVLSPGMEKYMVAQCWGFVMSNNIPRYANGIFFFYMLWIKRVAKPIHPSVKTISGKFIQYSRIENRGREIPSYHNLKFQQENVSFFAIACEKCLLFCWWIFSIMVGCNTHSNVCVFEWNA